jgi:carbohydrate-binding DOMON domain-containing protein
MTCCSVMPVLHPRMWVAIGRDLAGMRGVPYTYKVDRGSADGPAADGWRRELAGQAQCLLAYCATLSH